MNERTLFVARRRPGFQLPIW